jgi:hypothetical protein
MYPANLLGYVYPVDDLPDTVFAKWLDKVNGTMTRSGSEYASGTVRIRRNADETMWEFFDSADEARSAIGNCLIRGDGGLMPGDDTVEDQFEPTYNASYENLQATVTRVSLCVWTNTNYFLNCDEFLDSGQDSGVGQVVLQYLAGDWVLSFRGYYRRDLEYCHITQSDDSKNGPKSSPVGIYSIRASLS